MLQHYATTVVELQQLEGQRLWDAVGRLWDRNAPNALRNGLHQLWQLLVPGPVRARAALALAHLFPSLCGGPAPRFFHVLDPVYAEGQEPDRQRQQRKYWRDQRKAAADKENKEAAAALAARVRGIEERVEQGQQLAGGMQQEVRALAVQVQALSAQAVSNQELLQQVLAALQGQVAARQECT
jgi:hypothetical protein